MSKPKAKGSTSHNWVDDLVSEKDNDIAKAFSLSLSQPAVDYSSTIKGYERETKDIQKKLEEEWKQKKEKKEEDGDDSSEGEDDEESDSDDEEGDGDELDEEEDEDDDDNGEDSEEEEETPKKKVKKEEVIKEKPKKEKKEDEKKKEKKTSEEKKEGKTKKEEKKEDTKPEKKKKDEKKVKIQEPEKEENDDEDEDDKEEEEAKLKEKRTVFVGNIPIEGQTIKKLTERLKGALKTFGPIETARIRSGGVGDVKLSQKVNAKKGSLSDRGFVNAYIVYKDVTSANNAYFAKTIDFNGHELSIDLSGKRRYEHDKTVFIGNISYDCTEKEIRQHFDTCGKISHVRIVRDKQSGSGQGFGYVSFDDESGVLLALNMDGLELKDRKLRIQSCWRKQKKGKLREAEENYPGAIRKKKKSKEQTLRGLKDEEVKKENKRERRRLERKQRKEEKKEEMPRKTTPKKITKKGDEKSPASASPAKKPVKASSPAKKPTPQKPKEKKVEKKTEKKVETEEKGTKRKAEEEKASVNKKKK
ncbi:nucleolar protein 12-like [Planoprotostelium fungivorum]|uniref:Nucleolar protein 12-like n=1 Tax=Planoprotostelium fungivorum TaxID=1890364 RepID=A0A2P6NL46_9EUKA|nr:nucleolar protein 12-like [Planoprotostelium fungivorum]